MKEKHIAAVTLILLAVALIVVSIVMAGAFSAEQNGADSPYADAYFNPDTVNTVSITISDENWQDILENPAAKEYHLCSVVINGDVYNGTAIRTKGQSSLAYTAMEGINSFENTQSIPRYSFKIKADEYVNGQSFKGLSDFALNAMYSDSTYMKDYLTYELMTELGVPTPLYSYAALYINGEYLGLYLMLESVDMEFAVRNFGANYGQLYKPMYKDVVNNGENTSGTSSVFLSIANLLNGDRIPGAELKYIDDKESSYPGIFNFPVYVTPSTVASEHHVIEAIKKLNQSINLDTSFDIEEVLKFIAGLCSVVSLDSYVGYHCHNYFLYEKEGKLQMIPWDFNMAFDSYNMRGKIGGSGSDSSMVDFPIDTPVARGLSMEDRPLTGKLLAVDEYRELYHSYLKWIAEDYLGSSFNARVDGIEDMIGGYLKTNYDFSGSYRKHQATLSELKYFAEQRSQSILKQLNGTIPATWGGREAGL